jgi:hypothetical protein
MAAEQVSVCAKRGASLGVCNHLALVVASSFNFAILDALGTSTHPLRVAFFERVGRDNSMRIAMIGTGYVGLGGVDSKDSLLGANQIHGFFWEAALGDGRLVLSNAAWERMAADQRSTRPERLHQARQSDVRGRRVVDRAYRRSSQSRR